MILRAFGFTERCTIVGRTFDRLVHFDRKSRKYPIRALISAEKPRSYTWPCGVVLDQGAEGACHDEKTEVLTDKGWKLFQSINNTDKLASVNPSSSELIYECPAKAISYYYEGDMYSVKHRHLNFNVTPDHIMLVRKWNEQKRELDKKYTTVPISKIGWYSGLMTGVKWNGIGGSKQDYILSGIKAKRKVQRVSKKIPMAVWLQFLGIYIAEGTMIKRNQAVKASYKIQIAASKEREKSFIRSVLNDMELHYTELSDRFTFENHQIYEAMAALGLEGKKSYEKFVPRFIFNLPASNIIYFLQGHSQGDGHTHKNGRIVHYTSSKQLSEDIQLLSFLCGYKSSISARSPRNGGSIKGRQIKAVHTSYSVSRCTNNELSIEKKNDLKIHKHKGLVYCVEMPTYHTLVTRREGKILISGNCTGFAVAHEAAAWPVRVWNITEKVARAIYYRARQLDEFPGEDYEGSSVLGAMKAGQEKGWYEEYRWAFGEEDLALAVSRKGPCVLGINWYEGMSEPDRKNYIHPTGQLLGGHAILCRGYNVKKERYTLHNSWGRSWGIYGTCYISKQDMTLLLKRRGEACIPIIRKK